MKTLIIFLFTFSFFRSFDAQEILPYKNPQLPIEIRVADLLKRMTPEEKFRQLFMIPGDLGTDSTRYTTGLFGFQINTDIQQTTAANQLMHYNAGQNALQTAQKINAIQRFFVEDSRLGIPIIAFDEALHGLIRSEATAFPQAIGLAATFDTTLMNKTAGAIASECQSRGLRLILSPVVNLATDVRWGRVEETYGEDPLLTSLMGTAFVKAFEQRGIITTPKHFAVNHGEGGRDSYPINYSERMLEETYLVPFKAVIQKGGARSIMTAYNSIDGRPCSANDWLLNEKLKNEWGFRGFVISDAGAVGGANVLHFTASDYADAGKQSVENGLDVIFQTDINHAELFNEPFLNGSIDQAKLDSAVARVLRMKFELGLFEHPYVDLSAVNNIDLASHRALAKESALKSVVLLKNDNQVLPLLTSLKTIAVFGQDAMEARLGGYSGPGNNPVSIFTGLQQELNGKVNLLYAKGSDRITSNWNCVSADYFTHTVSGAAEPGLQATYFNNISLSGTPALERIDPNIQFQWTLFSPDPSINYDFFSARWTGNLTSPASGNFNIGIDGNDGYRLYLNDELIIDTWNQQGYNTTLKNYAFKKGKAYVLRLEYKEAAGNAKFRLIWDTDLVSEQEKELNEALKIAKKSDVLIVVAGIEEGEFRDRGSLALPGNQEELILKLAETGKPVIVLISGGSAVTMERWKDNVTAIASIWYPGEAGGEAVAELLTGKVSPSGKLPITFPVSEGQLPLVYNHKPTGRGDDYADLSGQPLFPFGYGLSYTTFEYSNLQFDRTVAGINDSIQIRFTLKNTGNYDAEEVVQLYLYDELSTFAKPVKELKGFQRIALKKGETTSVSFTVSPDMLTTLDATLKPVVEPGFFRVMIGSSSKDIRLRERIEIR
ncbi:MAG: glycoside hydrolase family 3 N-terminal domain-containing protein [Bacteroidota bacterium]